ncbi:enterochelin esterase-like enzyme [Paenibacillus endophyticus]|uniref:Enterochelin esterase-like enzyme n=1 Tax=Paenibacillus endophyticus TaxID=1294268 RepID=A0A7W5C5S9_9BACL|nr:alpha/beta hydrolase-fold protein [Paenibacillus endophyticus]MBB3151626.1 enterochelin esterase-like enzyme [Paenibacillus endophyticus]
MTDERYLKRTIVKETVPSRYLPEQARNLRIFLPPGYNEVLSYPVVYCQDGEDFFNFGRIATTATKLILDEGLEPFIIVGVDVDKKLRTEEYAPDGERHANYIRFFAEELIPFVEERYSARQNPEHRLLAGDSLGGSVSLHLALAYPQLFTRVMSLSGAYYGVSQHIISEAADLSWLSIYMIVGLQEDAYETDRGVFDFVALNRNTRALLEHKQASVFYEEKDGKHQWGFWQKELDKALCYFIEVE